MARSNTKMKLKTKRRAPAPTKPAKPLAAVPKDLKPYVLKKFRVRKSKTMTVVVTHVPSGGAVAVASVVNQVPTVLREFSTKPEPGSVLPEPFWISLASRMAVWYGRHLSLHSMDVPSARKERGRRRGFMKHLLRDHQAHMATRAVLHVVQKPVPAPGPVPLDFSFICVYHPKARPTRRHQPTTFVVHSPECERLEGRRRAAAKYNGDSWILEAKTPEQAVREQLAEFEADQMGYDQSDFTIHSCCQERWRQR